MALRPFVEGLAAMEHEMLDTYVDSYEEFGSVPVQPGEQVFLYRRMQDARDPHLVAVVNEMSEPIGYLDRELAATAVLPALKEGVRFQCVVHGKAHSGRVPIQVMPIAQAEVTAILERRGGVRRSQTSSTPPLAGVFDDDPTDDVVVDADAADSDEETDVSDAADSDEETDVSDAAHTDK